MAGYLISVWQMRGQRPTRAARHMHLRRGLTFDIARQEGRLLYRGAYCRGRES